MARKITKRERKNQGRNFFVQMAQLKGRIVVVGNTQYKAFRAHRRAGLTYVLN